MDSEQDIFSEGWSDEAVISDQREAETLPVEEPEAELPEGGTSAPETESVTGMDGQIQRFVRNFPEIRGQDIPLDAWERVRGGQELTEAYLISERIRLREENARLRAVSERRELNNARSAGSQAGLGFGETKKDAFEEGWDVK